MGAQPESSTHEVLADLVERVSYHNAENAPPNDPPACPAWGWGRKALKAQPSSATRGRARDRSASNSVASRFNVRSARNSFRRLRDHPRPVQHTRGSADVAAPLLCAKRDRQLWGDEI